MNLIFSIPDTPHRSLSWCLYTLFSYMKWDRFIREGNIILTIPKEKLDFFRALCNEAGVTPTLVEERP